MKLADAATELIEEGYWSVAARLWAEQHENEYAIFEAKGRIHGIVTAIQILTGKPFLIKSPPPFHNGMTCVAVNLLGEGLYRIYQGSNVIYYRWNNGVAREEVNLDNRGWLWCDPTHPSNASEK